MPDQPVTILHIDDDEANRYAVSRSLRRAGFEVVEGDSGQAALDGVRRAGPDLVILDVRLPDIDGFEVCRRIKADPATAKIPVLHLSASMVSGADKAVGLDGGADAYLVRPVEPVELVATVNVLLRQRRAEEALARSEERYRRFIAQSSEGIWRFEVDAPVPVGDPPEAQVDAFFRHGYLAECNDAMARMYGFAAAADLVGARLGQLLPPDDPRNREYLLAFVRAGYRLEDGESHEPDREGRLRTFANNLVGVVEGGRVVRAWGTQRDVTGQRSAEAALKASEARFRFLADLGDATRDLTDPARVMAAVARRLGEHLGASRCAYADVEADADRFTIRHDYTAPGVASTVGGYSLDLFGPRAAADMRAGRTLVVRDVDAELPADGGAGTFTAIGIRAIVCCPLVKGGRLVAMMAVHQAAPRDWSAAEVELVEEVVERSWAYVERARSRRAEAASEERFRRVVEGVHNYAIFTTDPAGVVTTWNVGAERVLGYAAGDILGRAADVLFTEEDRAAGVPARERATAERDGRAPDVRWHRRKDGSRFYVDGVLTAVRDEAGALAGFSKVMRDVTDRKRAEDALRASEARFRVMADTAPAMLWITEPDGACSFLSRGWYAYTGQADGEGLGLGWAAAVHPDDRSGVTEAFLSASAGRVPYEVDGRFRRADGAYRWAVDAGRPRFGPDGEFLGFVGVVVDIHDRKQAERTVRASEERFRAAVAATTDILWTNDADGKMAGEQPGWGGFTGQSPAEYAGYGWSAAVHPDDAGPTIEAWERSVADRSTFVFEHRVRRRDGAYRLCAIRAVPVRNADGSVREWVGVHTDVTDERAAARERLRLLEQERAARQQAEASRAQAEASAAEAEAANRLKDEFLATLSHELRTPLNAIVGWATVLGQIRRDDPDLAEAVGAIDRNARVQSQLIEDLLDVSRIISGKLRLDVQRTELSGVVDAAIASVAPAAQNKGIRIQKVIDPSVAAVWGDPARLQQVVWNLLSNAIKFTPKGGRVQVTLARVNSHVELGVSDTGLGIPAEFLPHVFERFRQQDATTTRRHGGLGLGLAIVKHLVELHGGTVRADSGGAGLGATFTVDLPLTVIDRPRPGDAGRVHPRSDPAILPGSSRPAGDGDCHEPTLGGLRVLVVDDEPDARSLLRRFLEQCDVAVTAAGSVREALTAIGGGGRFDVIISDIGMPERDGYDLIREVRALPADAGGRTPAIALTAFARPEDRRRALLAGFQIHVPKPVDPAELLAVVAGVAGRTGRP